MQTLAIARQPIFDLEEQLYGYELLYRGRRRPPGTESGDQLSARVILGGIAGIGLEALSGGRPVFINATRGLLMDDALRALSPRYVILEILEDIEPDHEIVGRICELAAEGYRFALDDCVDLQAKDQFLRLAEIVKVDIQGIAMDDLRHQMAEWRRPGVLMLAEKVETREQYAELYGMGFDLFQGYYFARPEITETSAIAPNKLVVLQLLARVNDPGVTLAELSRSIRTDVALSLGVLRWANSAASGVKARVDSIERAIVVLGLDKVRNLVSLLSLARLGTTPGELLTMVLVRARLCELLAQAAGRPNAQAYFTVGLLSAIDAIMGQPMDALLSQLPLEADVRDAIARRVGDMGRALAAVESIEAAGFDEYAYDEVPLERASELYLESVRWVSGVNVLVPSAGTRRTRASAA